MSPKGGLHEMLKTALTLHWARRLPDGLLFTTEAATVTADIFAIGSAQIIGRSAGDSIPIQPGSCSFARLMNGNFGFRLCLFITTAAPIDAGHILADWSFSGSFERKAAGDD